MSLCGVLFDDMAEATLMGERTARRAFHTFCKNFVYSYYSAYDMRPTGERLMKLMAVLGLPGCIGSTDCMHQMVSIAGSGRQYPPMVIHSAGVSQSRISFLA